MCCSKHCEVLFLSFRLHAGSQTDFNETIEEVGLAEKREEQMEEEEDVELDMDIEDNLDLLEDKAESETDDPSCQKKPRKPMTNVEMMTL